jgi:8-oxo-dGTP diphosphatase
MTQPALHSVSVSAIITNDAGHVLMVKRRDNGHWEPPGGVLELRESVIDGLRREVREETGLELGASHLTGVYKNMVRGVIALVFRGSPSGGQLIDASTEATALSWIPRASLNDVCDEAYAVRIHDALDDAGIKIRSHDGTNLI